MTDNAKFRPYRTLLAISMAFRHKLSSFQMAK